MARQFFEGSTQEAVPSSSISPGAFQLTQHAPLMTRSNVHSPNFGDAWVEVQQRQHASSIPQRASPAAWANEFQPSQMSIPASSAQHDPQQPTRTLCDAHPARVLLNPDF